MTQHDEIDLDLDPTWRALSDPTRRRILDELRAGSANTSEVCARVDRMSRHGVIKHLQVLQAAGLVRVEAVGRERINHLNPVPLQQIHERWLRPYEEFWAARLHRLGELAETNQHVDEPPQPQQQQPPQQGARSHVSTELPVRAVTVALDTSCQATPETVWDTLVDDIDSWWGAPYVRSPERTSLTLDARPGGVLLERWGDHGGAIWATVTAARRPSLLEFDGTFMMPEALAGAVDIQIEPDGGRTRIALRHRAIGAIGDETVEAWRHGWTEILGALGARSDLDGGEWS